MDKLWSPWRSKYIESFGPKGEKEKGCLFCRIANENKDKENYVVFRSKHSYIVMNLFPYNAGHLMIVPYNHCSKLSELDDEINLDCTRMVNLGIEVLEASIYPHGYNIGVNIGKVSGAGIEDHIHFHIVPRWSGDTNFMPVLNEVKIVSEYMEITYEKLLKALESAIAKAGVKRS